MARNGDLLSKVHRVIELVRVTGDDDLMNMSNRGEVFSFQQPIDRFLEVTDSFFRLPGFKSVRSKLLENINLFIIDID